MLTGKELGAAIEAARIKKRVTKKAMALRFGVSPPSIQDWVKRGTIDKSRLPDLWNYFSPDVGPEHWGLKALPGGALPQSAAKGNGKSSSAANNVAKPASKLSAKALSIAHRLDAITLEEHRRIAYALIVNILEQYEALEPPATDPHQPTKSAPRAKRSAARQEAR